MNDIDSKRRYDCFISFYGKETLASLGYMGASPGMTVRKFTKEYLLKRLHNDRGWRWPPNVFVDSDTQTESASEIYDAILQLRGRGVALVLLTREYLADPFCLAELRALLELYSRSDEEGRIALRLFCLETPDEAEGRRIGCRSKLLSGVEERSKEDSYAKCIASLKDYTHMIHSLGVSRDSANPEEDIVQFIASMTWRYWNDDPSRPSLGPERQIAFLDMQRFFMHGDREPLGQALRTTVNTESDEIEDVIRTAMANEILSYGNLDPLLNACTSCQKGDDAAQAVLAFRARWCLNTWSWSADQRAIFEGYVEEARVAVQDIKAAEQNRTRRQSLPPDTKNPGYTVFICAASEDEVVSVPLCQALTDRKFRTYLDEISFSEEPNAASNLYEAFASAKIAVFILSPHFIAKFMTMEMLRQFLNNYDSSTPEERKRVALIPVFYRVSQGDCLDEDIFSWTTADGENFFVQQGFIRAQQEKGKPLSVTIKRLQELCKWPGVHRVQQKGNTLHINGRSTPGILHGDIDSFVKQIVTAVEQHQTLMREFRTE